MKPVYALLALASASLLVGCASSNPTCCSNPARCATCPYCNAKDAPTLTPPTTAPGSSVAIPAVAAPVAVAPAGLPNAAYKIYKVAPKQMMQLAADTLAADPFKLKTTTDDKGMLVSDWKEGYEGEVHIIREWPERTRFHVQVTPDWQDPVNACRVEVVAETEARSNERARWGEKKGIDRPERAKMVLDAIDARLAAPAK